MAIRTEDAVQGSDKESIEEWADRFLDEIEESFDHEIRHRERSAYWRAVADMQEGRPLRP